MALAERDRSCPLMSVSVKHHRSLAASYLATVKETLLLGWVNLDFVLLGFQTCTAVARFPLH